MSRDISTHYDRNTLIRKKGTICANCNVDVKTNIIYHHIVPIAVGGRDIITNIVPLCENCHKLIHFGRKNTKPFTQSDLIKAGIKRAKKENKHIGRKKTVLEDLSDEVLNVCDKILAETITVSAASRELSISRPTMYKYLNLYKEHYT